MKEFSCRDAGMDCDFKTQGKDEAEIIKRAAEHGREAHGLKELSSEQLTKVRSVIRDVKAVA